MEKVRRGRGRGGARKGGYAVRKARTGGLRAGKREEGRSLTRAAVK